jgi:hypothetical protein
LAVPASPRNRRNQETPNSFQTHFAELLPPRIGHYWLFHDELKPERNRLPVTGHGTLLVEERDLAALYSALQIRRGDFRSRIHSLRTANGGPLLELAAGWLDAFFADFIDRVSFKATFALHDGPLPLPYPGDDLFQRHWVKSTKANLLGHVRWVLHDYDLVMLRPVFDGTDNARERMHLGLGVDDARFQMNERRRKGKRGYPEAIIRPVEFQTSDPRLVTTLEEAIRSDMLQLTDLLLGATADALTFRPGAMKNGRRHVAARVTDEMARRYGRSPYAFQRHQRHFSVSLYPDAMGRTYSANPPPKVASSGGRQLKLSWRARRR